MSTIRSLLGLLILLFPRLVLAEDPISDLQARIKTGGVRLEFEPRHGYLDSLLKALNVPVSSQTLVFSKTSLQSERISPASPRALYFNDDVYVAWVQGSSTIEIMSVDPKRGSIFFGLGQESSGPEFEQIGGHVCSVCHFVSGEKKFIPRLMVSSVLPDQTGNVEGTFPIPVDDQSPFEERWGGWYVTGTHGAQKHLGNVFLKTPTSPIGSVAGIDYSKSLNVKDLSSRFDTSPYPTPHSDIVALMVLGHQVEVHNLIALAAGKTDVNPRETGEPLVKALLFADAVPLKEPVAGTSSFSSDFAGRGPKDSRGRSLREFDLKTRLFRYPLSYMIYTKAFEELPDPVKSYVYRRLREVLTGADRSKDFEHLSASDRTAILEILRETKPDFPR